MSSHQSENQATEFGDQFLYSNKQHDFSHFPFSENTKQGFHVLVCSLWDKHYFYLFGQAPFIYHYNAGEKFIKICLVKHVLLFEKLTS